MGNDDELVEQVQRASQRAGEKTWHLPLPEEYRKHIDSDVADMKNIGKTGQAGTLVAGLLLAEFVGDTPWVHLDIAGPARSENDKHYLHKGATGFGVRTLLELVAAFEPTVEPDDEFGDPEAEVAEAAPAEPAAVEAAAEPAAAEAAPAEPAPAEAAAEPADPVDPPASAESE
jgi:hypothetical protein